MKGRIIDWLLFLAALAAELYCLYAVWLAYEGNALYYLYVALSFVSFPLNGVLHELGHMLFGAIVKIKAVPKFRFISSSSCKIIPKTDKNLRGKVIFTTCGGLAVNLLFMVLGVIALCVPAVPVWLCVFFPSAAYLFALNALPLVLRDGKTDGLVICELIKMHDGAKVMLAVLTAQAQILGGKPADELDEELLFGLPQIAEDDESFIALTELRYMYFKAKGDEETASQYLARFEELKRTYK